MKANELRIGNWVNVQPHDKYAQIIEIKSGRLDNRDFVRISSPYLDTQFSVEISQVNPIPLTEEILLKAGFEKCRKGYSLNVGGESFDYYIKDKFVIWDHKHRGYSLESIRSQGFIFYKYLHQFQNLFYYLCGEEIKIDLE